MAETRRPVALPTRWHVDQQVGTQSYPDEPAELIPAGTYLVGQIDDADPEEATTVVLRTEVAVDALGADQHDVVQAIADQLNAGAAVASDVVTDDAVGWDEARRRVATSALWDAVARGERHERDQVLVRPDDLRLVLDQLAPHRAGS